MAENEVVFRQYNERIETGFKELRKIADEENQKNTFEHDDSPLQFYCECSDENCKKRVSIRPSQYGEIHKRRDRFVVVCGHETQRIERVIGNESAYCIVEKFTKPPESATKLNKTETNNT